MKKMLECKRDNYGGTILINKDKIIYCLLKVSDGHGGKADQLIITLEGGQKITVEDGKHTYDALKNDREEEK